MTPHYSNKGKRRYYYYRCTKTFKKDWNSCEIRQVSAERLENYIFGSLERISVDKHYINSSIFMLNNSQAGDRIGLELSQACSESLKILSEIFAQTLQHLIKILPQKKGIEKTLWAKKFIKKIDYSKEEIAVILYYKRGSDEVNSSNTASGWVPFAFAQEASHGAAACRNSFSAHHKKIPTIHLDSEDYQDWLPGSDSSRTVDIILPNTIHGCKKKDL